MAAYAGHIVAMPKQAGMALGESGRFRLAKLALLDANADLSPVSFFQTATWKLIYQTFLL